MFGQKDDQNNDGQSDSAQATSDIQAVGPIQPADGSWPQTVPAPNSNPDVISPAGGYPSSPNDRITPGGEPLPAPSIAYTPNPVVSPGSSGDDTGMVSNSDVSDAELVDIKQKALSELVPLIDKLDQPPLEKFRTIMMMIQASDDQRLVEKAYESAHAIEDEEARAQSLLDIVNEINYFTQQPENKAGK